jgi:hypothetical protein
MRDKEIKYYMNQEFTDKAWQEMEKILDREMPVEKDRKKLIFWFRMAAGFLLLFAIGWIIFPVKPNQTETTNVLSPVTETIQQTDLKNSNTPKNAQNQQPATITRNSAKTQTEKPVYRPNSRKQNSDVTSAEKLKHITAIPHNPNPNEPSDVLTNNNPDFQNPKTDPERAIPAPILNSVQSNSLVQEITSLDFQVIAMTENTFKPVAGAGLQKYSKPGRIDMLLFVRGQSEHLTALHGYEAGLSMEKRLGRSKWTMAIGTAFQSEIRQLEFETNSYLNETLADSSVPISLVVVDPEFNFNMDTMDETTGSPIAGFSGGSQFAANTNLNVQLNYVAFPVVAKYNLTPRFGIQAGVTPSVFLFGRITSQNSYADIGRSLEHDAIYANNTASDSNRSYPIQNNRYFYFTSKAIAPAAIKRLKFPVHIGLDYQINRHLGVSLDYQYNPFRILNKDFVFTDNNQRFRLGANWKF